VIWNQNNNDPWYMSASFIWTISVMFLQKQFQLSSATIVMLTLALNCSCFFRWYRPSQSGWHWPLQQSDRCTTIERWRESRKLYCKQNL
jgi:hypothetical protein